MTWLNDKLSAKSPAIRLAIGAALLAVGAAGGAAAGKLTRPAIVMAPTTPTAIARLASSSGVISVKGKVVEVYGDRFVMQDATGRTMIDAGRRGDLAIAVGSTVTAQGRYEDGQLHAAYLVDGSGQVQAVGPGGRGPHGDRHGGPGREGPREPRMGLDARAVDPAACGPDGRAAVGATAALPAKAAPAQ